MAKATLHALEASLLRPSLTLTVTPFGKKWDNMDIFGIFWKYATIFIDLNDLSAQYSINPPVHNTDNLARMLMI